MKISQSDRINPNRLKKRRPIKVDMFNTDKSKRIAELKKGGNRADRVLKKFD